jgi:Ca2+-binding RTX toxin-like protein
MIGNAEDSEFTGVGEGEDAVDGGAGDDLVDGGDGVDDLDGGAGSDVLGNIDASAGMTVDLTTQTDSHGDTLAGFEGAWGSLLDDVITGTDGPNELVGVDGSDQLSGLGGDELLIGGFFTYVDPDLDTADGGLGPIGTTRRRRSIARAILSLWRRDAPFLLQTEVTKLAEREERSSAPRLDPMAGAR